MAIFKFNSPFVYYKEVSEHSLIKSALTPKIEKALGLIDKLPKGWDCDCISSFDSKLTQLNLDIFNDTAKDSVNFIDIIWKYFDEMLKSDKPLNIPASSVLEKVWFNHYTEGQYQEIHNHDDPLYNKVNPGYQPVYSGIYILEQLEDDVGTCFYSPGPSHLSDQWTQRYYPRLSEGHILIFPNTLPHYVVPAKGKRITVSFNIDCNYSRR